MFVSKFRRTAIALATVAALAATAPAAVHAADNGSTGTGDSDLCQTLLARIKRFHGISQDKNQPKSVREFYAAQAELALLQAKRNKCSFVAITAGHGRGVVGADTIVDAPAARLAAPVQAARLQVKFDRLNRARSTRRAGRIVSGSPTTPTGTRTVYIKANPTGNPTQDEYCRQVAELVDDAYRQGDAAFLSGDQEGGQAWYDLAAEFIDRATMNGCRFSLSLKSRGLVARVTLVANRV